MSEPIVILQIARNIEELKINETIKGRAAAPRTHPHPSASNVPLEICISKHDVMSNMIHVKT